MGSAPDDLARRRCDVNRRDREASFTAFVAARRTHLHRLAYAICGDWHEADDLVQTALVKLYVKWPTVRRDGREEAYVRRIILNAYIDSGRRQGRRREQQHPDPQGGEPQDDTEALASRNDVLGALRELPMMQRKVVLLRYWLDLSVRQTAEELGISEGTVKSHAARGLEHLRTRVVRPGTSPSSCSTPPAGRSPSPVRGRVW